MYLNMPQLIPFFFLNQVVFNFTLLILIVYMFSKYILPRFVRIFKTRIHVKGL
jgi:F-type H+-transporting ATPase subunit 8